MWDRWIIEKRGTSGSMRVLDVAQLAWEVSADVARESRPPSREKSVYQDVVHKCSGD